MEPFISNHQFNIIKHQLTGMQRQVIGTTDQGVRTAVKEMAEAKVMESFDDLTSEQETLLSTISSLGTEEERNAFLLSLFPYRKSFPAMTPADLRGLFPKVKKLSIPDLNTIDFKGLTYLGWKDIGQDKQYFVYPINGKLTGIQGRYVISAKKGLCHFCGRFGDIAFTSIQTKAGQQDPYKAFGHYICYDSKECNQSIQNTESLEGFLRQVVKM
ncbi:FusB/FusC family EF-G-binding protein [Jeotgalibacillus sp. R-1-5s-1]|uniref:FusB/FusC family EF-G-binding protein n=1 Tax=Jeotgalibacillus sp. R-1-5s-1 TaxID=2555897 RepID=UPI00106DA353|nr:FusB/FusC family EF-G-binding protein [Jeotgalibacillus sp. R-1-5s-1]TFD98407.1 elongation factor G-binding protein [Jeotgalibacillus sp. R-1-5s-1]